MSKRKPVSIPPNSVLEPMCWPDTDEERDRRAKMDKLRNEFADLLNDNGVKPCSPEYNIRMRPFMLELWLRPVAFVVRTECTT